MSTIFPWVKRIFDTAPPPELYPEGLERLRGLCARIEAKVRPVAPEILKARLGGAWSVQEHIGHLLDLESLVASRIEEFLSGVTVLSAADMENKETEAADHNAKELDQILSRLRDERSRIVRRLEGLQPEDFARSARHPRLRQPMNVTGLLFFTADHDDHHLARMTELIGCLTGALPDAG